MFTKTQEESCEQKWHLRDAKRSRSCNDSLLPFTNHPPSPGHATLYTALVCKRSLAAARFQLCLWLRSIVEMLQDGFQLCQVLNVTFSLHICTQARTRRIKNGSYCGSIIMAAVEETRSQAATRGPRGHAQWGGLSNALHHGEHQQVLD